MPAHDSATPGSTTAASDTGRTRAAVVDCIRRGVNTVEGIATTLTLTNNAVRFHLAALEDGGIVRRAGVARSGGVGKPPTVYELTEAAEESHSRAYAAVLAACIEELGERASPEELRALVQAVGVRLASGLEKPTGSLPARVRKAVEVLEALGGIVMVTTSGGETVIAGASCPLASVVAREPTTCGAVQALLGELIGAPVEEACDHGERPRCRFIVSRATAA
jgi:predicted ArsR family transcriptional regulator